MTQVVFRSRPRIAAVLLVCASVLLSGFATDSARAGETADNREVILRLTNEARSDHHRALLELDRDLSRYALEHSREMAQEGALSHSADLAAVLDGRDWSLGGENVGVADSLAGLHAAFMGSIPHRRNMLRTAYDHTAIGVVKSDGSFWVTVIFYG